MCFNPFDGSRWPIFGSIIRSGRITNSFRRGLTQFYNIEREGHVWYRGIDEVNIISKLNDNEPN